MSRICTINYNMSLILHLENRHRLWPSQMARVGGCWIIYCIDIPRPINDARLPGNCDFMKTKEQRIKISDLWPCLDSLIDHQMACAFCVCEFKWFGIVLLHFLVSDWSNLILHWPAVTDCESGCAIYYTYYNSFRWALPNLIESKTAAHGVDLFGLEDQQQHFSTYNNSNRVWRMNDGWMTCWTGGCQSLLWPSLAPVFCGQNSEAKVSKLMVQVIERHYLDSLKTVIDLFVFLFKSEVTYSSHNQRKNTPQYQKPPRV